jgi:hypothetical protein
MGKDIPKRRIFPTILGRVTTQKKLQRQLHRGESLGSQNESTFPIQRYYISRKSIDFWKVPKLPSLSFRQE